MNPDLIPREVRARLRDLRLTSRFAVGGHGIGQHSSRSRGAGLEFVQYRAYEPGDELRQVDWKLYARSDRYFVREAERDSPLTAWIVIDGSASMAQEDATRPGWSRLDAAKALAACCIELALKQGDRFGIASPGAGGLVVHGAGTGPRQRDRCLLALNTLEPHGHLPADANLQPLWERAGPGQLVVLLHDGFDEGLVVLAEQLAAARREVVAVRILTTEERDFPFRGGYRFRDVEGGGEVLGDAEAIRAGFLARFTLAREAQRARLAASGIRQVDYVLDEPLDMPLRRLFSANRAEARAEPA